MKERPGLSNISGDGDKEKMQQEARRGYRAEKEEEILKSAEKDPVRTDNMRDMTRRSDILKGNSFIWIFILL